MSIIGTIIGIIASPITSIINKYQDRKIAEVNAGVSKEEVRAQILVNEDAQGISWRSSILKLWGRIIAAALIWNAWLNPLSIYFGFDELPRATIPDVITLAMIAAIGGYIGIEKVLTKFMK